MAISNHIDLLKQRSEQVQRFANLIKKSQRIVLLPHTAPDGDALGSTLALRRVLTLRYPEKSIDIISPDHIESYLSWMEGVDGLTLYPDFGGRSLDLIHEADLLLHLDHNVTSRLRHEPLVSACQRSVASRVLIDHHLDPSSEFELVFSYPSLSSTCHLVYILLCALGWQEHIDPTVATHLLTGMITDTGRFLYNCTDAQLFSAVSELIACGAGYAEIIDRLSYHGRIQQLLMQGYALYEKMELYPELQTAVIVLSQDDLLRLDATKGDTEGLVNLPLSVEGITSACLIREDKTQVKLSMRSMGDVAVNLVANRGFGGGGHLNAAGAEYSGTTQEAKNIYLYELEQMLAELYDKRISGSSKFSIR